MFSTTQQTFIDNYIPQLMEDYSYYIVYSNTTINSGYNYTQEPDLYIVASNKPITCSSPYKFSFEENCQLFTIRTPNYSTSSYADNSARIKQSTINGTLEVNSYESIYTNCEYKCSIRYGDSFTTQHTNNVSQDSIGIVLSVFLLLYLFLSFFSKGGHK